ncbi:hypothetical protein GGI35DRAFT_452507 [Trichoderma velutinum]
MDMKLHALYSIVICVFFVCSLPLPTVAYTGSEEARHTGTVIGVYLWWLESICCLADHLFSDPSPKWLTSCSATALRQTHVRRMYVCRELTRTQENKHSAQIHVIVLRGVGWKAGASMGLRLQEGWIFCM